MKKKPTGLLKPLSLLLFMLLFVNLSTTCKAYTLDDYQLNDEIMEAIVNEVGLGNYFSGDYIPTLTNNFNLMMRTVRARGDYHQVTLADCIFFKKSNTQFAVTFDSYRDSLSSSQQAFMETQYHYFNVGSVQESTNGNISVLGFVNWIYDNNNNISTALTESIKYWYFNYNGYGYSSTSSNTMNVYLYENDTYELTVGTYVILDYSSFDYHPMRVYRYSSLTGYNEPFYENIIYLGDFVSVVTPTPIPTSGGGGGGGSTDLTQTNNLISNVNSTLEDVFDPNIDNINSGDINLDTSDYAINDPTTNFFTWTLNHLQQVLTTNEVKTITIDFLGIHTIRSDFFVLPSGPVRTLLTAYFTFIVGYSILKDVRATVESFKNGNIEDIASDDINANIV